MEFQKISHSMQEQLNSDVIIIERDPHMNDEEIVKLYWDRNEQALQESSDKYGAYCTSIARNILNNVFDAQECVNDTWLRAWNSMPPHRPSVLSVFLGRITRNLSFDLYRRQHRDKRGGSQIELVLDELEGCVSGNDDPQMNLHAKELKEEINRFLNELPKEKRYMFILRYWYADSISDIAERFSVSENSVSVQLSRIRAKLRIYLRERGYDI